MSEAEQFQVLMLKVIGEQDYLAFERDLAELINKHSMENKSGTPDKLLARYLVNCLKNFDSAVIDREQYEQPEAKTHG